MATNSASGVGVKRWGAETALLDDDEARRRLVAATVRCLVAKGTARLTVEDVAREAGVARSTVYRYFSNRDELLLGVLVARIDASVARIVKSLRQPDDARKSIVDLIIRSIRLVDGDPVNEALFAVDSWSVVTSLELTSDPIVDTLHRHLEPSLSKWQADGQLHGDLNLREVTRWINTVGLLLLAQPWVDRSERAKRSFLDRFVVRALVVPD